jgi:hypothetical protein
MTDPTAIIPPVVNDIVKHHLSDLDSFPGLIMDKAVRHHDDTHPR